MIQQISTYLGDTPPPPPPLILFQPVITLFLMSSVKWNHTTDFNISRWYTPSPFTGLFNLYPHNPSPPDELNIGSLVCRRTLVSFMKCLHQFIHNHLHTGDSIRGCVVCVKLWPPMFSLYTDTVMSSFTFLMYFLPMTITTTFSRGKKEEFWKRVKKVMLRIKRFHAMLTCTDEWIEALLLS